MVRTTVFILFLICISFLITRCRQDEPERFVKEDLDRLIGERLKPGSHKSKVLDFLKEQKITNYEYKKNDARKEEAMLRELGKENSIPSLYDNDRLRGKWRDIRYGLVVMVGSSKTKLVGWTINIWIRFFFDEDEKLIAYTLEEITDSP